MAGQDVFKGALGWDDWVWWAIIGGVGLLILLLLVCCCVCVQRAKRKGHEEALATVQRRQRLEADARRQAQQLQQQQQMQQVQHLQPQGDGFGYPKAVSAAPMAAQPRKNVGPQVAANGYMQPQQFVQQQQQPPYAQQQPPYAQQAAPYAHPQPPQQQHYGQYPPPQQQQQQQQYAAAAAMPPFRAPAQHQDQFQKPYPPLPQQQQHSVQFQEPSQEEEPPKPAKRRYHPPTRWYNALAEHEKLQQQQQQQAASPTSGSYHNQFAEENSENSIDSIRYDPYGTQGNLNSAPFVSVTSPTGGNKKKVGRSAAPTLSKTASSASSNAAQLPPPVVVQTKYQSAPPLEFSDSYIERPNPTPANPRTGANKYGTLADRINALREDDVEMAHSRVSDAPIGGRPSPSSTVLSDSAFASYSASSAAQSKRAPSVAPSVDSRRSGVLVGSVLSPTNSAATSNNSSARRREHLVDESFDGDVFASQSTIAPTGPSQRSMASDYSHGQFEDAEDHLQPLRPAPEPSRWARENSGRKLDSRESVEF